MKVAGVVLAAGASRRMGSCKALLREGGVTFLDQLGEALIQGGCAPVLAVVASPLDPFQTHCRLRNIGLVTNPDPARGQISSLRCALEGLSQTDAAMWVLVDQARLMPKTIEKVREAMDERTVAIACHEGHPGHPVAFPRRLFPRLLSSQADAGAQQVIAELTQEHLVRLVEVCDPGVIRNLNTPAQARTYLAHEPTQQR